VLQDAFDDFHDVLLFQIIALIKVDLFVDLGDHHLKY